VPRRVVGPHLVVPKRDHGIVFVVLSIGGWVPPAARTSHRFTARRRGTGRRDAGAPARRERVSQQRRRYMVHVCMGQQDGEPSGRVENDSRPRTSSPGSIRPPRAPQTKGPEAWDRGAWRYDSQP
jgi:hypothetical protein